MIAKHPSTNKQSKNNIRPFLKWAGGKYRLTERIRTLLPEGNRLIEPFTGSGAVFLNTDYERYLLGDINPDLIDLFHQIQNNGEDFIQYANQWFVAKENSKTSYYHWRERFNQLQTSKEKSALFLYLNRHGFNGLCRYNQSGLFNVPFGSYKKPYYPTDEMAQFSEKSKKAIFVCCGFNEIMNRARKNNVVYCDPPYIPLSDSANFTSYAKEGFGLDSQHQLSIKAYHLSKRGVPVLISNHENALTTKIYEQAKITKFKVQRRISCKGAKRNEVTELLALYQE